MSLPSIQITSQDLTRLSGLVSACAAPPYNRLVDFLEQELDRAEVVEPVAVPPDVVTMNTCLRFRDEETGQVRVATLVYPGEEDSQLGRISILTPVGSALIGLAIGQSIRWRTLDGREKRLTVTDVLYQPEAHGRYDL